VVREASFGGTPYRVSSVAPGILARARTRVDEVLVRSRTWPRHLVTVLGKRRSPLVAAAVS